MENKTNNEPKAVLEEIIKALKQSGGKSTVDALSKSEKQEWIFELLFSLNYESLSRDEKGMVREYIKRQTGYSRAQTARLIKAGVEQATQRREEELRKASEKQENLEELVTDHKAHKRLLSLHNVFAGSMAVLVAAVLFQSNGRSPLELLSANLAYQWDPSLQTTLTEAKNQLEHTAQEYIPSTVKTTLRFFSEEPANIQTHVTERRSARLNAPLAEQIGQSQPQIRGTTNTERLFASAPSIFDRFATGTNGQVLMVVDGVPQWTFINQSNVQSLERGNGSRRGGGGGGGSAGATGATGEQGPAGPAGAAGAQGDAGPTLGIYNSLILESSGDLAAGNASGQNLVNLGLLTASGKLIVEDNVRFNSGVILNGVTYLFPIGDGSASGKVLKTDGNGNLSWSTDAGAGGGTVEYAGRGLTKNGENFISLNATITGSLVNFTTLSGATVRASDSLASSGTLVIAGVSTLSGAVTLNDEVTFGSGIIINGVTYIFPAAQGSSGTVLGTDGNGNLTWTSGGSTTYAGQGLTQDGNFLSLSAAHSGTTIEATVLLSGASVHAQDLLTSSGSAVIEGEVTFGSGIIINGVTYIFPFGDGSGTGKVLKTDGNGNLSWSTDLNTGSSYYPGQGLSLDGSNFLSLNAALTGTSLEVLGTASGRIIHAQDALSSSGSLIVEHAAVLNSTLTVAGLTAFQAAITGTDAVFSGSVSGATLQAISSINSSGSLATEGDAYIHGTLSGNTIVGFNLTDCDNATTSKLLWDATTQTFSCGADQGGSNAPKAAQGLTLNGDNFFALNTTISGSILDFDTISGAVIQARDGLTSSGGLTVADTTLLKSTLTVNGSSALQGVTATTLIATLVEAQTLSGSTIRAQDFLASSGALSIEGTATLNDEVVFGSGIIINGVTYIFPFGDGSGTGKVLATDGNGNLSWTASGGGGSTYYAGQGLSLNGSNFFSLSAALTGTSLEIYGTASGRTIHAEETLTSSGNIIVEGAVVTRYGLQFLSGASITEVSGFNSAINLPAADLATRGITRLQSEGNLVNIGTIQAGEAHLRTGGTYLAKTDYATGSFPHSVLIRDVNGDGNADLVVANYIGDSLSIYLNNGDGTFAAKVDYSTPADPHDIDIGDLNGDGIPDLATISKSTSVMSVFITAGDGAFENNVDYTTGSDPRSVTIADVNRDGKPDIAVANYTSNTMSIFLNKGNGTFASKVDYATGTAPYFIVSSDVNGDGMPDLAVANSSSTSLSVFINNGNGTFASKVDYATGTTPYSIATGDLNADGYPDLAVANAVSS
ncbi:MAG: VCBS repeat-containing protein, partial [Candidatus Peregrinibacteria bacterium]|nr:VCBS repeat-containing protein [Candidatus Peregrinibacteria bacterium]